MFYLNLAKKENRDKDLVKIANRHFQTIKKMITEWQMIDLEDAILREIKSWEKNLEKP